MNLIDQINQSNYVFYFLVVDNFLDILVPQAKNLHLVYASKPDQRTVLSQQKIPHFYLNSDQNNIPQNSGKLLSDPQVQEYIKTTSKDRQIVIVPFKPSAKIEFICRKNNWICAATSHKLNRFLEDKNEFAKFCQKYRLPTIPSVIDSFNQENFLKYQNQFQSTQLVVQTHFGWAGKSTFSANNWDEIKDSIAPDILVKFSPFLSGYSLLNNCCLTSDGLIQSPPALQYTGIKPLTNNPFTTVGRQWPCLAPIEVQNQVKQITSDFSKIIQTMGYLGFFGLDFLVASNQVYLLECNPRLTASFAFYTQIEINQKLDPLFFVHLSQFIKLDHSLKSEKIQQALNLADITGSEVTLKNQQSQTIKKYHDFIPFVASLNQIEIPQKIVNLLHEEG